MHSALLPFALLIKNVHRQISAEIMWMSIGNQDSPFNPGVEVVRGDHRLAGPREETCQIVLFIPWSLHVIVELNYNDIRHDIAVLLSATTGKSIRPWNTKNVNTSSVAIVETRIIETVSVDSAIESFDCSESEFHPVGRTWLANCERIGAMYSIIYIPIIIISTANDRGKYLPSRQSPPPPVPKSSLSK